jgi:hypothetical protein
MSDRILERRSKLYEPNIENKNHFNTIEKYFKGLLTYGQKLSWLARKLIDKFTSKISPFSLADKPDLGDRDNVFPI